MATKLKLNLKLSTRSYIVVVSAVAVLVLIVSVLFGQGVVQTIILQTKVQVAKNTANSQLDKDKVAVNRLVANYQALDTNKTLLANALPTTPDMPGLIASLENMANTARIKLMSISPSQAQPTNGATVTSSGAAPQTVGVSLTVGGDYTGLHNFLTVLENSARPIRVTSIQISGNNSDLAIQMNITSYFMAESSLPFKTEIVK